MITCKNCNAVNTPDSAFCIECGKPVGERDTLGGLETPEPGDTRYRHGGTPPASFDLAPGTLYADRYKIIEKIGQGGMGVVYRAEETLGANTRPIALKLIRADRLGDGSAVNRLVNEGMLTQDIRHENVVAVYNVGLVADQPFVAMEYCEGVSLRSWLRQQMNAQSETPLPVAAALVRHILDGLEAAHKRGVIHRDLKPENVILTGTPEAADAPLKLLDFGIARAPGTQDSMTGTGLGTQAYMAPEQITNPAGVTASADLYSLSIMFYELLMGVLPAGHWQPPSGGRGDVPEAIDRLIKDGLANRPLSRPQSVAEYRQRLDAALAGAVRRPGGGGGRELTPAEILEQSRRQQQQKAGLMGDQADRARPAAGSNSTLKVFAWVGGGILALLVVLGLIGMAVNPYEKYSGDWNIANGVRLDITADADGSISGTGFAVDSSTFTVAGNLESGDLSFADATGMATGSFSQGQDWCHLNFTVSNAEGSFSEVFHVNHMPGQPCPAE